MMVHSSLIYTITDSASISDEDNLSVPSRSRNQRPNIIFLLADDLGYGDVGYNGGFASTPNINEMARGQHSIQFNQFYSGSPVCSPTRGTILTGRNHNRYCLWSANTAGKHCSSPQDDFKCPAQYPLPQSEVTVAEILKEQGYKTAVFGKWHLGDLKPLSLPTALPSSSPAQNGFDVWKVTERAVPTATPNCGCYNTSQCILGHYKRREEIIPCTNYHTAAPGDPTRTIPHDSLIPQDDSNFIVDELLSFISNVTANGSTEQPFFAYVPFHGVHKRYIAVPPFSSQYSSRILSQEDIDYFGTISAMDAAIGRIRATLQELGISSNTMLWFTSDNGPAVKSPGNTGGLQGNKGTLFEGGIRVPGIIEWSGMIDSNRLVSTPVVTNDFLPTVCDVLGISPPVDRSLDGESILPLLLSKTSTGLRNSSIKWAFKIKGGRFGGKYQVAIVNNRNFKLIANYQREKVTGAKLYDLSRDLAESTDVSTQHQDTFKELLEEVESWRLSVKESAISKVRCHTES